MENLRLILLIIGVLAILSIYFWEVFFNTSTRRSKRPQTLADPLDTATDHAVSLLRQKEVDFFTVADLGGVLTQTRDESQHVDEQLEALHTQHDLNPGGGRDGTDKQAKLLILYIVSPRNNTFHGAELKKAMDSVGMVFGKMNIFHYKDATTNKPLFSMVNRYEPGYFEWETMDTLETKGIALFMYISATVNIEKVFKLFIGITQRLADMLMGEVRTEDDQTLDATVIATLSKRVKSMASNEQRAGKIQ